jgi:NitT/TauT family transport system ATP-binding protein
MHQPFGQGGMQEDSMTIMKAVRQDPTEAQRIDASKTGSEQPVIQILSATKIFPNGTQALSPIELNVQQGEFLSLIGPSGCGKSTLLKMIANLIEPTDGRILWWNGGPGRIGSEGSRLAFVFQDPTLMPWARVDANVRLALDLEHKGNKSDTDVAARIHAALDQVGLTKFARSYPRELSGGMRMRVSIARALIDQPDLLLMDEPFGALDEFTRNKLDLDLVRLSWERRLTTLFVTHSIYEAVFLSTRIVVMAANPGRIHSELVIDEPQPRDEDFRGSPRFAQLCRDLSRMLTEASNAGSPQP